MEKINLLDLSKKELTEFLVAEGMKKFYGKEVFIWLHKKFARNIQEMTIGKFWRRKPIFLI